MELLQGKLKTMKVAEYLEGKNVLEWLKGILYNGRQASKRASKQQKDEYIIYIKREIEMKHIFIVGEKL